MSEVKMSADALLGLLARKHSDDVFVPECKDGPTQFGSHLRMDAWVMPKSWSKPATTGYEIKVSRSDFLRDDKWTGYLNLCHRFYFVCAPGVIQPAECPESAGLLVATKTGTRLITKKKAPEREVEVPESVWRYVLMCRSRITRENTREDRETYWHRWLAEKDEAKILGTNVSRKIQELVRERIEAVESRNRSLEFKNKDLAEVRKILAAAGIDNVSGYYAKRQLEERLHAMSAEVIPKTLADDLAELEKTLGRVRAGLAELQSEPAA